MGGLFQHLLLVAALLASLLSISANKHFDLNSESAQFQAHFDKLLHPHGAPDLSALEAAQANAVKPDATGYMSTGYVTRSLFMDSTCSQPDYTYGTKVNVCLLGSSYGYMFRLVQDNCVDGVIEYYHDQACTRLAASVPMSQSFSTECLHTSYGAYGNWACTSKSDPLVYADSMLTAVYKSDNCGSNTYQFYFATPVNQCLEEGSYDYMFTCNGGLQEVEYKAGSGCTKQIDSTPIPNMCFPISMSDDDDDNWDDDWDDDDWDDDYWDDDYWDDDDGDDDDWDDDYWDDDDDVAGDDAVATDDTPSNVTASTPPPPSHPGPVGGPVGAPGGGEPGHVGGAPGHAVAKKARHYAKKLHQRRHGKEQHKAKGMTGMIAQAKKKALRSRSYPTRKVSDMSPGAAKNFKFALEMARAVSGHKVHKHMMSNVQQPRSKRSKKHEKDQAVSSADTTSASDSSVAESVADKKDARPRHRTRKTKGNKDKKHAKKHSKKDVSAVDAVDAKPLHQLPPTPRKIVHELAPQPLAAESVSAAHAAHPAAAPDVAGRKVRKLKRAHKKSHQKHGKSAGGVSTAEPVPQMVTTDDDVNYYDDDGDDRYYIYDDYVYIYPHDDDYNFFDDDADGDDDYDDDDAGDYDDDWWRRDDDWTGDDDFHFYYGGVHPPPSVIGTPFPTTTAQLNQMYSAQIMCAYAKAPKDVSFTATQTISGISLDTYNSNVQLYSKTLKQSIAACVSGATEDSVTNLVVTAGSSSSVTTVVTILVTKRILATSSIVATYTVTVTGTTKSSSALAGELNTAVTSGTFDNNLHTYAQDNGATGFETATSTSIDVEYNNDDDSSSGGPALSVGAIVGITIGCVAFVVLVAVGLVFLFGKRGASPSLNAATRANPATEMHVNPMQPGTATSVPAVPVQMVPVGGAAVQSSVYNPKADSAPAVEVKAV